MRTKKIIVLCSLIAILLGMLALSACSGKSNPKGTHPSASAEVTPSAVPTAGLQTSDPEATEPGNDFSDMFGDESATPTADSTQEPTGTTETVAPTQSATVQPTQKPTQSVAPTTSTPVPTADGTQEPTGTTETIAPTQSATAQPTQKPTQSVVPTTSIPVFTGGLNTSTETPGANWGPLM